MDMEHFINNIINNFSFQALDDTLELLKETARLFYQNTDQNVTINLYFALGGVILAIGGMEHGIINI